MKTITNMLTKHCVFMCVCFHCPGLLLPPGSQSLYPPGILGLGVSATPQQGQAGQVSSTPGAAAAGSFVPVTVGFPGI